MGMKRLRLVILPMWRRDVSQWQEYQNNFLPRPPVEDERSLKVLTQRVTARMSPRRTESPRAQRNWRNFGNKSAGKAPVSVVSRPVVRAKAARFQNVFCRTPVVNLSA